MPTRTEALSELEQVFALNEAQYREVRWDGRRV